ncbi:MAG: polysaccharide deacetylase family protein [Candidatus Omnitrophota bacterium]
MRIALTFDDGPNGEYTLETLRILKKHGIKACFFFLGKNVERLPEVALKTKQEGHLIGNHTYDHQHIADLTREQILLQIEKTEEIFSKILHIIPKFIRMPYGESNEIVEKITKDKGYTLIGWDPRIEDHKKSSPEEIIEEVMEKVRCWEAVTVRRQEAAPTIGDGIVITLHDGANIRIGESRANTVKALPEIIRLLKNKGFEFVGLDQFF